ncbi:Sulfur carrier protein adenylyltransferase ThiF [Streptomyces venezuelae]|uniref:rhodanese-like domain-containing protein n=1 Tax=Streptomyces gardneri TaxID=66892 RepID=UPI0006BCFFCC|nr:rhodanese-like domain-containing protein [Streptomyces gardneri]ALO12476.1 Sulfur carrier protein adenylyltransferase ThiF [Streptomyces venezuelae]QPK49244.1 rhodanese-like domain-containing protein [Streptomyces gardneri]WRK40756.1 rhodanese-like domain-containing protein [Streptomyces venezuelae]CUM36899.1 Sulfur carrier protein adenylyltransferase ThiF [Streptomyces venezuelae]
MSTTPAPAPSLTPAVLHRLVQEGRAPRLLDVRTPGEFRTAHIPGSYNVPLATLREHRAELRAHLDEEVVLLCRSGARAAQAEQALAEAGLPNLRVLEGGVTAWEAAGGPVTRGPERWDMERQVRLVAGSIVLATGLVGVFVPGAHLIGTAVGAGLTYAALSNSCMIGVLLSKLPYNRGPRTDLRAVIAELRSTP